MSSSSGQAKVGVLFLVDSLLQGRREQFCFGQANCIKSQGVSLRVFLFCRSGNIGKAIAKPALLVPPSLNYIEVKLLV